MHGRIARCVRGENGLDFSVADKKSWALSIRDYDEVKKDVVIKHYRIRPMDNGGCYISPKRTFNSIMDLVEHYKREEGEWGEGVKALCWVGRIPTSAGQNYVHSCQAPQKAMHAQDNPRLAQSTCLHRQVFLFALTGVLCLCCRQLGWTLLQTDQGVSEGARAHPVQGHRGGPRLHTTREEARGGQLRRCVGG